MNTLKVTELTVWKDQLFGLSEDGHLVAWNEDMGSWVLRGACEIKNFSCENEHMIKVDRPVEVPMSRHDYEPGKITLVPARKVPWYLKHYWSIYTAGTIVIIALGLVLIFKI